VHALGKLDIVIYINKKMDFDSMQYRELFKSRDIRVVLYKHPLEFLRFGLAFLYIVLPFALGVSIYNEGSLISAFGLIGLLAFSLGCATGAYHMTTEYHEDWNRLWGNKYSMASAPSMLVGTLILLWPYKQAINNASMYVLSEYLGWVEQLNYFWLFAGVSLVSYLTLSAIKYKDGETRVEISTGMGMTICLLIAFVTFLLEVLILFLSGVIALYVYALFLKYEDVRYPKPSA